MRFRSLVGGWLLLMSILGCAHLGKPPSQTSATGSASSKTRSVHGAAAEGAKVPSAAKGNTPTRKGQSRAAAPSTLGLSELEQRLRDTRAIGVFTKLSLKNQIDDLLGQLRAYHLRQTGASLPQLRQRYDVLVQKVIDSLQSGDASLARDISSSREAIWTALTDPTTMSKI
jgi:hypothetical protein